MLVSLSRITAIAGVLTAAINTSPASTATFTVNVQLVDASEKGELVGLQILMDHKVVKAGRITFQVANTSKALVHEMLLLRVGSAEIQLPYSPKDDRIVEGKVNHLGEVPDLKPGTHGTLTTVLAAGSYLLLCNQPAHFHAGMWTPFTVVP